MKFLTDYIWRCKTLTIPLITLIVVTWAMFFAGHRDAAVAVSQLGTALVLLGNLVYITFVHSRSRWPDANWSERLTRVLTFQR